MRYHSVRGLGDRYLVAVLLPISGVILVIYTVYQLVVAHVTNTVPPPRRIAEAQLPDNYTPPPVERFVPSDRGGPAQPGVPASIERPRHGFAAPAEPEPTTKRPR